MAGCITNMLCSLQYKWRHWFENRRTFFSVLAIAFTGRETYFRTRYKWKKSMKQLFNLCSTWQQHHWKRCIRVPFSVLFQWAASPAFPQPIKLPWQQSEWLRHGEEKCTVVEWKEITKGINSMSSLPAWKNVYKSGRWLDPNNNLLRAMAQYITEWVRTQKYDHFCTKSFPFQPLSQHSSAVTLIMLVIFQLILSIFLYYRHKIDIIFFVLY